MVRWAVGASWPLIIAAKRLSAVPGFRSVIRPFFAYPFNEVTAIPIGHRIEAPENVVLPRRVVERLVGSVSDLFILDQCICRRQTGCRDSPQDIGCLAMGPAISRMHPSHGRKVDQSEAVDHVRRAADAGLIANVAHTWIDPLAFGLTKFDRLMFICFCDDCCCLYRTHMQRRGESLNRAYQRLPGISVVVDAEKCTGCGICVERCFVAEMKIVDACAGPGPDCKGCGRCAEVCPTGAVRLEVADEETLYKRLVARIEAVADIW
jgi:ferredoxin